MNDAELVVRIPESLKGIPKTITLCLKDGTNIDYIPESEKNHIEK